MSHFYVVCDLGAERGRIVLGSLQSDQLITSEIHSFQNLPVVDKEALLWNMPQLFQEVLEGLRGVASYQEPVAGITCSSWGADYLLFEADGSLIPPTFHEDGRNQTGRQKLLAKVPWETIYAETGVPRTPATLCQLATESSRRLKRAACLLPIADGFNYLLAGVPRVEMSLAGTTQLFNPVARAWSARLLDTLRLRPELLPPLVPAGTPLGPLGPEIAKHSGLEDTRVVAACSHEMAATLVGLPVSDGENWAFIQLGSMSVVGTQLPAPIINEATRDLQFTNQIGYGGKICFYRQTAGLWLLEQCQRYWGQADGGMDADLLSHLASSAPPFEFLIDPADPRFLTPGDMPLKIQAFCKESGQPVPRKPGQVFRCILESLALLYRRTLGEIEKLTGAKIARLFILGNATNTNKLLHHFTANALEIPVVVVSADTSSVGNVVVQALALGHLPSLERARHVLANCFKAQTIIPHGPVWGAACQRVASLFPAP